MRNAVPYRERLHEARADETYEIDISADGRGVFCFEGRRAADGIIHVAPPAVVVLSNMPQQSGEEFEIREDEIANVIELDDGSLELHFVVHAGKATLLSLARRGIKVTLGTAATRSFAQSLAPPA